MKDVPKRLENETVEAYVERLQATVLLRGNSTAIRPGHLYKLNNVGNKEEFQVLQFIEKEPKWPGSTELIITHDGTTSEAVLEMLIDRSKAMYDAIPSEETMKAIQHLEAALRQLELRTIRRLAHGTEGTKQA